MEFTVSSSELLDSIFKAAPFFAQLCQKEDIALAIADKEKLIFYSPDRSNPLDVKPGSLISKGQGIEIAMTTRQMVIKSIGQFLVLRLFSLIEQAPIATARELVQIKSFLNQRTVVTQVYKNLPSHKRLSAFLLNVYRSKWTGLDGTKRIQPVYL